MEVSTTSTTDPIYYYNYLNNMILNPTVFIIIALIIIAYLVLFSSLGNSSSENNNIFEGSSSSTDSSGNSQTILGMFVISILIILILINGFQYFFSVNVTAYLSDFFTSKPKIDIVVDDTPYQAPMVAPVPEIKFRKQVFNIPGNYYNYENAKAICSAYGADLATYKQIENSYENGGEWCNYGWSDGQMALFPTQQTTYDNLQNIQGHEHDCGRPGVNGGYIANPQVKFGVNCYGNKPRITNEEEELMENTSPYPQTVKDIAFQKQVDYWRNQADEILVSPFNYNSWGEI